MPRLRRNPAAHRSAGGLGVRIEQVDQIGGLELVDQIDDRLKGRLDRAEDHLRIEHRIHPRRQVREQVGQRR